MLLMSDGARFRRSPRLPLDGSVDEPKDVLVIMTTIWTATSTCISGLVDARDHSASERTRTLSFALETLALGPLDLRALAASDVDHDGDHRSAGAGARTRPTFCSSSGSGLDRVEAVLTGCMKPSEALFADLNRDGILDIVALDQDADDLIVQLMQTVPPAGETAVATSATRDTLIEGKTHELFMVEIQNTGVTDLLARSLSLTLTDESGSPLPRVIANDLFTSLSVAVDDGSGSLEPGDPTHAFVFGPNFGNLGEIVIPLDGLECRVGAGSRGRVSAAVRVGNSEPGRPSRRCRRRSRSGLIPRQSCLSVRGRAW